MEDPGILIVSYQALAHRAVFVADVEQNAIATVAQELTAYEDGVAAQRQLVAAGLPAAIKVPPHRAPTGGHPASQRPVAASQ